MQSPLESEEAAFRFVLGAIVYFAAIVLAAWIATWLGVIAFVVMSVVVFLVLRRGTASEPRVVSTERAAVEDTRRILVVTDALPVGPRLREAILQLAEPVTEDVLVVWAVATSPAAGGGEEELETALHELRAAGINARGSVATGDPLRALEDALGAFDADEVVISVTAGSSAEAVVGAARSLVDGPVNAIVEDGAR